MTFITWVAYVQKTYTKQVWSIVYLSLGFVRTPYAINEWLHTFFLSNPVIKGVEWDNFTNYYEWIRFYLIETTELGKKKKNQSTRRYNSQQRREKLFV